MRMVGILEDIGPERAQRRAQAAACCRVRVIAMRLPKSGRRSNQLS